MRARLRCVTLTGADDNVDPHSLIELHKEYPFVEFAILFSKTKSGSPRYPSREWVARLADVAFQYAMKHNDTIWLSAHLCGEYVQDILESRDFSWKKDFMMESLIFQRIQLNMSDSHFKKLDFHALAVDARMHQIEKEIIIQTQRPFVRAHELGMNTYYGESLVFTMLFDQSGGRGIEQSDWPKPDKYVPCGYAGGINPSNISKVLGEIASICGDIAFWIDMESGIRDNDLFSLEKSRQCLDIAKRF